MGDFDREVGDRISDAEVSITERFTALFEHMQEGVALHEVICDAEGRPIDYRILDVNPQFEQHTGLRRSEVAGKLASVVYGTGAPPYLEEFCAVGMGAPPRRLETFFPPLNRHFSISVAPLGPKAFATIFFDITLTKQQEESIEKSRLHLRALLDNQPHLAWLKDREGRFLAVNRAFSNACGQPSPESVAGKTDLDVWPRELAEAYRADDAAVIASATQKAVEEEIADINGTRWFETYKSPVYSPDGAIVGTTGVSRDVTFRKRAEEARLQSERKFAQVFDQAPDLIAVSNWEGELLYVNRAYCRVVGMSREELLGRNTMTLGVWENSEIRSQSLVQLQREGRFDAAEIVITSNGGERRHLEVSGSLIELDGKTAIIAAGRDVTEHRLAERAAAASREQLLRVSELAHIGHFTIDGKTREITWTAELFRIFGREPHTFKPTIESVIACVHKADADAVRAAVDRAITTGEAQQVNHRILRQSGEVRFCLTIVERGDVGASGAPSIYGLVQDLTELRRAEENQRKLEQQVMQAQKLESLGVLAGGIAHDFNNLLTSILGNADLALSELSPANPARTYLDDIETVTRRAADLCRQMLAYSGKGRFVVQPLSLNDLVREIAYLLTVSISKKVVVKYNFFPDLPSVLADATQVRQIVMNLITNASEAIGEVSGVVTLSTGIMDCDEAYLQGAVGDAEIHPEGQYVFLEVSDTGCGMDSDTLSRIFDPFFTTKFTGRGLGLAAVLGIVRGHKGALRVYSEQGCGTTFKVLLPSHRQPAQTLELAESTSHGWRGRGTVLLADDEESIRSMGRRLLERAGFEVLTASDGREAVELYLQHRDAVRLVVLDLTMPHLDGEACFRELRRADPRVKVIMTSGYNEQDVVDRFVGKGLAGFVQKPYRAADLLPKVREVLGE